MSTDVMKPSQRYKAMAHNRGRTGPELALASGLWRQGLRYFTHEGYKSVRGTRLPGNPDMVLPRKRIIIFVDGCFWHGCPQCRKHEGLNGEFWVNKIAGNRARDRRVTDELEDEGWTVLRIPEHDIDTKSALSETVNRLVSLIRAAPPGSAVREFVLGDRPDTELPLTAVSLFSGAGLSDLGYEMAGFRFAVQVELDRKRAAIGAANFPYSTWLTRDVCGSADEVATAYRMATSRRLDLLVATPPCQGMSSSNPSRGKRRSPRAQELEAKNRLMLEVIPVARRLKPRVIVAENVRPVLTLNVEYGGANGTVIDHIRNHLSDYEVFPGVVNVADYGHSPGQKACGGRRHTQERTMSSEHVVAKGGSSAESNPLRASNQRRAAMDEHSAMAAIDGIRSLGRQVPRHGARGALAPLRAVIRDRSVHAGQPDTSKFGAQRLRERRVPVVR